MARRRSDEEVEHEHLQAMGPLLGPLYHDLWNEVAWLHVKWKQYRILFAGSREDVDVLNKTAGFFFLIVQGVLWDDVLLHLARLVDPPHSLGKADQANVTLRALSSLIQDTKLCSKVRALVAKAQIRCAFAVAARHRRIAHRDLALAIKPLNLGSRAQVEAALESIRAVLGSVHGHYLHTDPGFERFIAPPAADALLFYLRRALTQGES